MARDKILTLTPEQHKLLGHALALAHAVHSQMGGNGLGVAPGELPAIYTLPARVSACVTLMRIAANTNLYRGNFATSPNFFLTRGRG